MDRTREILDGLAAEDNLRTLRDGVPAGSRVVYDGRTYVNMSSNDYLGLSGDVALQSEFFASLPGGRFVMSNPSSRLMTGNSNDYSELESALAGLYAGKTALILGSGYLANSGVLPAVTSKGDLILADKLVHASLIDGLRLCGCEWQRFRHNDMEHLGELLRKNRDKYNNVWVVTESVFSMDGDRAPLRTLVEFKHRYGLKLYVDEAHAFGVYGANGAGYAASEGIDREIDIIMATFGKAAASYGAFVAVDPLMRELLVNRMRTLIFATALPPVVLQWTRWVVERMPQMGGRREHLRKLIAAIAPDDPQATHIIPLMAYGNAEAVAMAERLRAEGFWVTPIRYPTVPQGQARIRVSLSAALTESDINNFTAAWKSIG